MKTLIFLLFITIFAWSSNPSTLSACDPDFYFLFQEDAQARLDSLNQHADENNLFERMVLMHNLGFHKDKDMRKQAEKLFKKHFKDSLDIPLYLAYSGSLQMVKVSHRSKGGQCCENSQPL